MNQPPLYLQGQDRIPDLLCLSHLRWNWVFQRPQHLLTRAAQERRVVLMEEPLFETREQAALERSQPRPNITVATPRLPKHTSANRIDGVLRDLLDELIVEQGLADFVLWYYTPMALPFSEHLDPKVVVYDCMDQLSAFAGAPPELLSLERALLNRCDLLFTGGLSLHEAKRIGHPNAHCFPSSVDVGHFAQARQAGSDPDDQRDIPHLRLGYFGVIDERLDLRLIADVARSCESWHILLVGPVAKIDERLLPHAPNIHYLGPKGYQDLPFYVAGWDVAWLPFAHNQATRFISPTKTPEYLAAGKPVVSTSIRDVVRTYGQGGYVYIADTAEDTIRAVKRSLLDDPLQRLARVDRLLEDQSWDKTWGRMRDLIANVAPGTTLSAKAA